MMPAQKPHRSRQDYGTPRALLDAVKRVFGEIDFDLAADASNAVAPCYYTEADDALRADTPWPRDALCWLNPPFGRIAPWAARCAAEAQQGARVLMLAPASIGSAWFAAYVHKHAYVLALRPRLTFAGCDAPYPKDCILAVYGFGEVGFDVWEWR
jgi:phage N-6-adenine-methyltransferase